MTNEAKELTQYITAIFTLFTGIVMCFLSFFLTENHVVHDSVLWYFGETIAFTGSIFSVGIYVNHQVKKAELPEDEEDMYNEEIQELITKYNKLVDEKVKEKETELMSV